MKVITIVKFYVFINMIKSSSQYDRQSCSILVCSISLFHKENQNSAKYLTHGTIIAETIYFYASKICSAAYTQSTVEGPQ